VFTLPETLSLGDSIDRNIPVALLEILSLVDSIDPDHLATFDLQESLALRSSGTTLVNIGENQEIVENEQWLVIVTEDSKELVIFREDALLSGIIMNASSVTMNYTQVLGDSGSSNDVTITTGWTLLADIKGSSEFDIKVEMADSTTMSAPNWNGLLELPTFTPITIPDTETETFSDTTAIEIGSSTENMVLSEPVRIEFTGDGGEDFIAFFESSGDSAVTFIDIVCDDDDIEAVKDQLSGSGECKFDDTNDLIIWTYHFTAFGDSRKSSKSSPSGPSSPSGTGGSSGGGGGGGGGSAPEFAGILGTPLTINEVSYDRCDENMARILISSDAEIPPTVILHTTKAGTVYAQLAEVQPFAESNQITKIDKYVYEAPLESNETFMMVVVTEIRNGIQNKVQSPIYMDSCSDTIAIADTPGDETEISLDVPRIFDVKFQIANGAQHLVSTDSVFYVDNQNFTVSAIIDSKSPLKRVELRTVPMGQSAEQYVAMKMDIESIAVSETSSFVSATLPSYFMVEPGIKYWIHVFDEDLNTVDSIKYKIGVKPTRLSTVSVEMDVPTIKPTGASIRPEVYILTDDTAAYGIVSLIVNGEVISQRTQLFEIGQTKVTFDWNIPKSNSYSSNELQGKVDLYDSSIVTESATVHSYPRTISISASELTSLELIEIDGQVVAEPALIYSSNSDENLQFRITDPQGQCVIGSTDDCTINESTKGNRGGLTSIMYGDQTLRVRYSGADNALERFSITSIDPIIDQWTISLEAEDGILQEAHATTEPIIKIKYRYHSETVTVFSK
jgi:uncharacterized membrane protein YgcG